MLNDLQARAPVHAVYVLIELHEVGLVERHFVLVKETLYKVIDTSFLRALHYKSDRFRSTTDKLNNSFRCFGSPAIAHNEYIAL